VANFEFYPPTEEELVKIEHDQKDIDTQNEVSTKELEAARAGFQQHLTEFGYASCCNLLQERHKLGDEYRNAVEQIKEDEDAKRLEFRHFLVNRMNRHSESFAAISSA
jgi:hypothetical protein